MTTTADNPVALTIAGSDSGGGAGIQADLKTFAENGVHGTCAIAAITAQNTRGVTRIDPVPVAGLLAQLAAVFDDFEVAAIKIGMLGEAAHTEAVAQFLRDLDRRPPIVLDPVMVATSGDRLLTADAISVVREQLLPLATLATPNLDEAALLAGTEDRASLEAWAASAPCALLITGGDEGLPEVVDTLWRGARMRRWSHPRRAAGTAFHGTGCTLSSAIAAGLAWGDDLETATVKGLAYVQRLIIGALVWNPGHGHRVLPHGLLPDAKPWSSR